MQFSFRGTTEELREVLTVQAKETIASKIDWGDSIRESVDNDIKTAEDCYNRLEIAGMVDSVNTIIDCGKSILQIIVEVPPKGYTLDRNKMYGVFSNYFVIQVKDKETSEYCKREIRPCDYVALNVHIVCTEGLGRLDCEFVPLTFLSIKSLDDIKKHIKFKANKEK